MADAFSFLGINTTKAIPNPQRVWEAVEELLLSELSGSCGRVYRPFTTQYGTCRGNRRFNQQHHAVSGTSVLQEILERPNVEKRPC